MDTPTFSFSVKGERYDVDLRDFTPADAGDFRRAVGVPLSRIHEHISSDVVDIFEIFTGLVWLVRRRLVRGLSYSAVADSFTIGDFDVVDPDAPADAHEEASDSPE